MNNYRFYYVFMCSRCVWSIWPCLPWTSSRMMRWAGADETIIKYKNNSATDGVSTDRLISSVVSDDVLMFFRVNVRRVFGATSVPGTFETIIQITAFFANRRVCSRLRTHVNVFVTINNLGTPEKTRHGVSFLIATPLIKCNSKPSCSEFHSFLVSSSVLLRQMCSNEKCDLYLIINKIKKISNKNNFVYNQNELLVKINVTDELNYFVSFCRK